MPARPRTHLKQEFQDGERPSGQDFADVFDSFLSQQDDGVSVQAGTLVVNQGLRLGNSNDAVIGTMRFNGAKVQVHDGANWVDIGAGGGGGGAFVPLAGGDVAYTGGKNVGIGASFGGAAPTYRLEVDLALNSVSHENQVRFGQAALHHGTGGFGGSANFSHRNHASNTGFALRQNIDGRVFFNAPTNVPLFFTQGGNAAQPKMTILDDGRVVVGASNQQTPDAAVIFQVAGEAGKPGGGPWKATSDARTKENVEDYRTGLDALRAVRPVRYTYNGKAGTPAGWSGIGIIGQEIESVIPETISVVAPQKASAGASDGDEIADLRVYDANALTYVLVNAVKELAARVDLLEARLAARDDGNNGNSAGRGGRAVN